MKQERQLMTKNGYGHWEKGDKNRPYGSYRTKDKAGD